MSLRGTTAADRFTVGGGCDAANGVWVTVKLTPIASPLSGEAMTWYK